MEPIDKDNSSFNFANIKQNQKKRIHAKDNKVNLQGIKNIKPLDKEKIKKEKLNKLYIPSDIQKIKPEVLEKSEGLYCCTHRKKDKKSEGFFYYFELKKEFQNLNDSEFDEAAESINDELYPAMHFISSYNESLYEIYRRLGYQFESHESFVFPDDTVILDRYRKMQQKKPNLPNLEIISVEDEINDKLFINTTKKGKILLSNGRQFIHDHTAHIITRIELLYFCDKQSYDLIMQQFENTVDKIMGFIHEIEFQASNPKLGVQKVKIVPILPKLLWSGLGLLVDNASAISSLNLLKNFLNDYQNLKFLITHDNQFYFNKLYGSGYLENKAIFEKTWHDIIDKTFEEI